MKHKVKIIILSVLGVLLVGSSVAYAYSQKGTLISQKTEELPDGNIYVAGNGAYGADINNADQSIRVLDLQNHVVRTVAGSSLAGYNDANGSAATFSGPEDVAVDKDGLIYVLDRKNNVVRKIVYE